MLTERPRAAFTIVELLVVLTLGGVLLALFTGLGVRQQRLYADLESVVAGAEQLRQTASLLPIELRAAAPSLGDFPAGVARDTAVQFRATIASAVVCDVTSEGMVLAAASRALPVFASFLTAPQVRDTAWMLVLQDSSELWRPVVIDGVAWRSGCAPSAAGAVDVPGQSLFIAAAETQGALPGAVVRITRPVRYSLYRASDGRWYLGQREWNPGNERFNTVQPVSGPFARAADGGVRIRYWRGDGSELAPPVEEPAEIELIEIMLRTDLRRFRGRGGNATEPAPRDSIRLVVRLRNP